MEFLKAKQAQNHRLPHFAQTKNNRSLIFGYHSKAEKQREWQSYYYSYR